MIGYRNGELQSRHRQPFFQSLPPKHPRCSHVIILTFPVGISFRGDRYALGTHHPACALVASTITATLTNRFSCETRKESFCSARRCSAKDHLAALRRSR